VEKSWLERYLLSGRGCGNFWIISNLVDGSGSLSSNGLGEEANF
jgi:hypothetical protein